MKFLVGIPLALVACCVIVLALVLLLSAPATPPPLSSMSAADEKLRQPVGTLPPYGFFDARDGSRLAYRFYEGKPGGGVAIAIHGSTGLASAVHAVAQRLAADGMSVYAVDLRGHGESGPLGDIGYRGQLEDDLSDLLAVIGQRLPNERKLLIGHSLGGGFTLRVAGEPLADRFDAFLALSPFIAARSATNRPDTGGWANVAVPRMVALSLLDRLGVTLFDGLSAVAFAVPADAAGKRAKVYSYRLLANMSLPRDWAAALGRITRPTSVLVGADDALFVASAYAGDISAANPRIAVSVLPGIDHMGMVIDPVATAAVSREARRLIGTP